MSETIENKSGLVSQEASMIDHLESCYWSLHETMDGIQTCKFLIRAVDTP